MLALRTSLFRLGGLLTLIGATFSLPAQAASDTWNGGSGSWSLSGNWTPASAPGSGDTAYINAPGSNQIVTYDSASSGLLGTLNLLGGGATNELDVQKSLTITTALTLSGGTILFVDSTTDSSAGNYTVTDSAGLTLNSGGTLELRGFVAPSGTPSNPAGFSNGANFTGAITISGGALNLDQAAQGSATATSSANTITGNLSMSSGNINLGTTATTSASGSLGVTTDNRLTINGTFSTTGGTITNTAGGGSIYIGGTAASIMGTTLVGAPVVTFNGSSNSTLTTDQVLGAVGDRLGTSGGFGHTLKVVNSNATSTGNIGSVTIFTTFGGGSNSLATDLQNGTTFQLGSNLKSTTGATGPAAAGFGGGAADNYITVDLNGFTYDLTNNTSAYTPGNNGTNATDWVLTNSTATNGVLKATAFNLSTPSGQTGVTVSALSGGTLTLQATGGTTSSTNLGVNALSTSAAAIGSNVIFQYTGSAAAGVATEARLTSNRTIGQLQVQTGAMNINQASLTAASTSVTGGGTLDFNGASIGTLTLTSGSTFTVNSGTLELNLGTASDQIIGVSGDTFSLTNLTLSITQGSGFSTGTSYALFTGFSTSTAASNIATNVSGFVGNIDSLGNLTFSAVPEPGALALMFGGLLVLLVCQQRRKRA